MIEITPEVVRWRDLDGDHETPASAVFTTLDADPDTALADELRDRGVDVTVVGDAAVGAGLLEHRHADRARARGPALTEPPPDCVLTNISGV